MYVADMNLILRKGEKGNLQISTMFVPFLRIIPPCLLERPNYINVSYPEFIANSQPVGTIIVSLLKLHRQ